MAAPELKKVRNIVLVGQDGAGKTSLAEAMLFVSGRTSRMGTTHDGKSNLDYDQQEIKRKFTINTSLAPVEHQGCKINVLDTSGNPDFIGETLACMSAAEFALFVIDAVDGPGNTSTKLWRRLEKFNDSRGIFINHIDREHADFEKTMAMIHAQCGHRVACVNIPIGQGPEFKGIIDVIRMQARYFDEGSDKERIEDIPEEYKEKAKVAREKLIDVIAEADDDIMMKYLEGETISDDEFGTLLKKAIAKDLLIPVFVGSTLIKQGINHLMDDIVAYFPNPVDTKHFFDVVGEPIRVSEKTDPAALVFKTVSDPYVGRISFLKVISGVLEPGLEMINSNNGKKERLGRLYLMMGKETEDVKSARAGDIIVVPKLNDTKTGDTLCSKGSLKVRPFEYPKPMYPVAIEAVNQKESDKLGTFIAKYAENDPTIKLDRVEETHQTVLTAMGDTQVDTILARCKEQTGVEGKLIPVRIPYRETIKKVSEAQGRHKKQSGGAGQFGDCWIRLEPNPGGGYEFINEIVGGRIPTNYIPAVDKGIQEAMEKGYLAGYPMVDLKAAVYDGSSHSVDSSDMAFKIAASLGFKNACAGANPVILEPMADMRIAVTEEFAGTIMGDISTKRGRVMGTDSNDNGETVIIVRAPYAEVVEYTKDLRSMTRGSGSYELELNGYEEAPMDVAKKLQAEYEASKQS